MAKNQELEMVKKKYANHDYKSLSEDDLAVF